MRDNAPLVRQWKILAALTARADGISVQTMARDNAVNEKTIRRDLIQLRKAGFPVAESVVDHGRKMWRLTGGQAPPLAFNWMEAASLYLARRLLAPLAGTYFWNAANDAFSKIRASLGERALQHLDRMAAVLHPTTWPSGDYSGQAEIIDRLMIGAEERKTTFIEYQSARATEPVSVELNPYGIIPHRGSLYLVADSRDHGEIRHFKVDRIGKVEVTNLPFPPPVNFDLRQHLNNSFGILHGNGELQHVRILFNSVVARYVSEKKFHASQRLTKQTDGRVLAEFDLDDLREIKAWILSFGPNAQVLAPNSLRREICADLGTALEMYQTQPIGPRRHIAGRTVRQSKFRGDAK